MGKMEYIRKASLDYALSMEYRQYLTGHLTREQKYLQHVDDDIEVGISHYRVFTADKPHVHPLATEHGYVLEGSVKILLLDGSGEEYQFDQGDFFVLRPGIGYVSKNRENTRILFIKSPGINDKTEVPVSPEVTQWLSGWD